MKKDKIKQLLPLLNSKRTGDRGPWVEAHCPIVWKHGGKDAHPSFGIKSSDKKKSLCKCLSCGFGGDLMDLALEIARYQRKSPVPGYDMTLAMQLIANEFVDMELNPADIPEYDAFEPLKVSVPFPGNWLSSFSPVAKFKEAYDYCLGRQISPEIMVEMDLRFDPVQRRVGFPFRNAKGQLMGMQGRAIDKDSDLRYFQYGYAGHRNMHVWYGESWIELDEPLILVEGPVDLTSVYRVYQNVAASFTSGLSVEKIMRIADASTIYTFYDHGKGGDAAREKLEKVLKGTSITHVIPTKEEGDAGAMTLEQVKAHLLEPA